jgi:adenine deaminase
MSELPPKEIAERYAKIDQLGKAAGTQLAAPFMTLSFMALLVIPKLKLSDLGLFDAESFTFVK